MKIQSQKLLNKTKISTEDEKKSILLNNIDRLFYKDESDQEDVTNTGEYLEEEEQIKVRFAENEGENGTKSNEDELAESSNTRRTKFGWLIMWIVLSSPYVNVVSPIIRLRWCLIDFTPASQIPPKCEAAGGMKCHLVPAELNLMLLRDFFYFYPQMMRGAHKRCSIVTVYVSSWTSSSDESLVGSQERVCRHVTDDFNVLAFVERQTKMAI
ncbi:hypothetical protein JTB14_019457 [Gonioctena quinquepunctata]|nr:hypothetical protein JTB14_019457 [Gonioctena quinquepunctata]